MCLMAIWSYSPLHEVEMGTVVAPDWGHDGEDREPEWLPDPSTKLATLRCWRHYGALGRLHTL